MFISFKEKDTYTYESINYVTNDSMTHFPYIIYEIYDI